MQQVKEHQTSVWKDDSISAIADHIRDNPTPSTGWTWRATNLPASNIHLLLKTLAFNIFWKSNKRLCLSQPSISIFKVVFVLMTNLTQMKNNHDTKNASFTAVSHDCIVQHVQSVEQKIPLELLALYLLKRLFLGFRNRSRLLWWKTMTCDEEIRFNVKEYSSPIFYRKWPITVTTFDIFGIVF